MLASDNRSCPVCAADRPVTLYRRVCPGSLVSRTVGRAGLKQSLISLDQGDIVAVIARRT
ncbi:MAG: hypothetical protein ABIV92_00160 [Thermoflexales bacterium]